MARELPNVGTVRYNGFPFPAPFDADVQALPIRDTSRRYIKYTRYTITIKTILVAEDIYTSSAGLPLVGAAGAQVDPNLESLRCRLEKAGGSFIFVNQGIGRDFGVNAQAEMTALGLSVVSFKIDPTFGPFPTIINWKPAGSNRAVHVTWSVEVTIPECCGDSQSTGLNNNFLEHNFSVNWNIDDQSATTRTINGYFETPGYRTNPGGGLAANQTIATTADARWEQIFSRFPHVRGFRRSSNHALSLDKRQINYTIVDTEIPSDNPMYPYMVNMDVRQRVSAHYPELFKPHVSVSGTITIAPNVPRHLAYNAFAKIAKERYDKAKTVPPYRSKGLGNLEPSQKPNRYLSSYSFEENIFGREFSFEYSWWFLCNITDVFKGSGLFLKIEKDNPNWVNWTDSMAQLAQSARGLAKMRHNANDDNLLFVCNSGTPPSGLNNFAVKSVTFIPQFLQDEMDQSPTQDQSYQYAEAEVGVETNVAGIIHMPSEAMGSSEADMKPSDPKGVGGVDLGQYLNENSNSEEHTFQLLGPSYTRVVLRGRVVRVKFRPQLPTVTRIGGQTPKVRNVKSQTKQIGKMPNGDPIFAMSFRIDLALPKRPSGDILGTIETSALPEKKL